MTEKRFEFKRFYVDIANINEIALYEIDNNPHDDLDDTNLFYVYSTTDANVKSIVDKLNSQEELIKRLKTIREEQTETILKQKRKIRELTAQLQTDDVCTKCKHHYLINYPESSKYYISKCKKEHEECSKEDIRYCEDFEFELDGDVE